MNINNIIDYFSKIYYINLKEDNDKKRYFLGQINNTCIKNRCERFNAVSGKLIDIRLIEKYILTDNGRADIESGVQRTYGISLTYGSLGCALSHYLIFKECSLSKKPFLVLEDDIIIDNNFDRDLSSIIDTIKNIEYDIFYLGYNEIPGFKKTTINSVISKPTGLITGTYGMIISPEGSKKLISTIFPLDKQIDSSISDNQHKLTLYCSTQKIISANTSFVSKTQRKESLKNSVLSNDDPWYKLFSK